MGPNACDKSPVAAWYKILASTAMIGIQSWQYPGSLRKEKSSCLGSGIGSEEMRDTLFGVIHREDRVRINLKQASEGESICAFWGDTRYPFLAKRLRSMVVGSFDS